MKDNELLYKIALSLVPGLGNVGQKLLLNKVGSAKEVFELSLNQLLAINGVGEFTASAIRNNKDIPKAEATLNQAEKSGVDILSYESEQYPKRLKKIFDAPLILYKKGNFNLNANRVIAIVGTRSATVYGKSFIENFIKEVQELEPMIISGLALGIDTFAHKFSFDHQLTTIGVMASGLDYIYPSGNRNLALNMLKNGGILSEYPFGIQPERNRFPARNRIIAGLSDCVIVVESAAKGGAMITAHQALEYNREVFAVPGDINKKYSAGCNELIKSQSAVLIRNTADLIDEMNWKSGAKANQPTLFSEDLIASLDEDELLIIKSLEEKARHIDELCWNTKIPLNKIAGILLNLELKNVIRTMPGKMYALN